MRKHRKLIAVFCFLLLVIILSIAFSGDDENITIVRVWSTDGQNKLLMTEKVDEFNATIGKEKGIKIEYRVFRDGIDDYILEANQKGDLPEIFGGGSDSHNQLIKEKKIININDLPGGREFLLEKAPGELMPPKDGEKELKVRSFQIRKITGRLIYNKDLFEKAGIVDSAGNAKPPKTWAEFVEYSRRIHQCDSTKFGTAFPFGEPLLLSYSIVPAMRCSLPAVYEFDFEDKTCRNVQLENIFNVLKQLKEDGSCLPGLHTLNNDTLRHQFAQGNIGMFFACSWDVGVLTEQFPAKCNWGVAPYPTFEDGIVYSSVEYVSGTRSISVSALKDEKTAAAVMEVFKWLYSDEMLLEHYEKEHWIPLDKRIRAKADTSKMSEQWLAFCKEEKITGEKAQVPVINAHFDSSLYADVWTGKLSFDDALKEANERATKEFRQKLADGTIDPADYQEIQK